METNNITITDSPILNGYMGLHSCESQALQSVTMCAGGWNQPTARWKDMLARECRNRGDKLSELTMTLTKEELEIKFDDSFGGTEGCPFTAWSDNWVYFPVQYDGSEWVGSVPRNPCDIKTEHIGG